MADSVQSGIAIWTRQVDHEQAATRWSKLALWYGGPSAIALAVAVATGGFGAMLGVLILLGGIGALLALGVLLYNHGKASNPEIRLVDGSFTQGKRSVPVAEIEAWTTHLVTTVSEVNGPAALAMFRVPIFDRGQRRVRPDGGPAFRTVDFAWAEMSVAELDGVRVALAPHIRAPWVTIEQLRA